MLRDNFHPSDQELLSAADGELNTRRSAKVYAHLAVCQECHARMAELEETSAGFEQTYRQSCESQLPSIAGPRALLRAQLAELAVQPELTFRQRLLQCITVPRAAAYAGVAILGLVLASGLLLRHFTSSAQDAASASFGRGVVPNRRLTPGATRSVSVEDVCTVAHEDVVQAVPASLQQQVLRKYGIVSVHASDYEIDYLIAPGLGGAEDIRNLWPEPYNSSIWNAHVKDALEEHLHQMVCSGKIDLHTAQRDISTDWIAAYKKQFHTDLPLAGKSEMISD